MPSLIPMKKLPLAVLLSAVAVFYASVHSARSDDAAAPASQPVNLALNKAATASSVESDDHAAGKANDGDDDTRWCADGETVPQWWQVDLEKPHTISSVEIKWEFDEKVYKFVVEGSADATTWKTLSDQSQSTAKTQVQKLKLDKPAEGIRYVRIRITGLEDGCWASMFEVKVS